MRGSIVLVLLAGCPTVDLGDTPPDIPLCTPMKGFDYFVSDVWPKYITNTKKNCLSAMPGACHANTGGLMVLSTQMPDTANYEKVRGELSCTFPTASKLFTKPCGIDPHFGNQGTPIFSCGGCPGTPCDAEVVDMLAWFQ